MKYFLDVAATEHMTKSAQRLHVAQPALSRSIARMEAELGVQLFRREGRGLKLTEEGRSLQRSLAPIVSELDAVVAEIAETAPDPAREVRVQLGAASHIAADAIALWLESDARRKISLMQYAGSGEPDVVIDSLPLSSCSATRAYSERVMLAAAADKEFAHSPVALADLTDESFIALSASSGFSRFTHELCEHEGFKPHVTFESDNPSVVRKMISLGLGVGFWPERSWSDVGESSAQQGTHRGKSSTRHGSNARKSDIQSSHNVRLWPLDIERRREVHVSLTIHGRGNPAARAFYERLCMHFDSCFK